MYKCIDLNGHAIGICSQTLTVLTTVHVKLTNLEGLLPRTSSLSVVIID